MDERPPPIHDIREHASAPLPLIVRLVIGGAGLVVFAAGTASVFFVNGNGGAGAAALLAIGALALVVAAVGAVPPSMSVGGVAINLPEKAAKLASEADRLGRPDVARALRVGASLAATAEPFAEIYESLRRLFPGDADRTKVLDALFQLVRQRAAQGHWSLDDARSLFATGRDGARVFALAIMSAYLDPDDVEAALEAAASPRSDFEQYHALQFIQALQPMLDAEQSAEVRRIVEALAFRNPHGARATKRRAILEYP